MMIAKQDAGPQLGGRERGASEFSANDQPQRATSLEVVVIFRKDQSADSDRPNGNARGRMALTIEGPKLVSISDRFIEIIIHKHRLACYRCMVLGDDSDLREFEGIALDGVRLVSSEEEFFRVWLGWS